MRQSCTQARNETRNYVGTTLRILSSLILEDIFKHDIFTEYPTITTLEIERGVLLIH